VQYNPSIPRADGGKTPTHHQQTPAKASKTGDGNKSAPSSPHTGKEGPQGAEESVEGESSSKEGAAVVAGDGDKPQGNPGGSANAGAKNAAHPGAQNASGVPASHSDDDSGSSPLVPILIAIAVLAAISVAVVMVRQRRGPNASASPEAH
jgi:cobalamin biosynthesis Mg chelatase CobN